MRSRSAGKAKHMSRKDSDKKGSSGSTRTIKVDYLARVEGEGSLYVKTRENRIEDIRLEIFEPPRFFEALLRGRRFEEAPDITARICGICPVAYQMSACNAMENAFGVRIDGPLRELRRLIYFGEWIESHTLHIYMLHAPDFLGYQSSIDMAKDFPEVVKRGLRLKKAGNSIMTLLGGREIHPINVRVGGFYRVPERNELISLTEQLEQAREDAIETVKWVSGFDFPELSREYEFVSLMHPDEYPVIDGRIVSSKGMDIGVEQYDENFTEEHVEYSNALHSKIAGRGEYFVGPMARFNLNFGKLSSLTKALAEQFGLQNGCTNPFKSIIVRSLEVVHSCDQALQIIGAYTKPEKCSVDVPPVKAVGYGCSEAPRGLLYHRYEINSDGEISDAKIVPPTSQNQKTIESDLHDFIQNHLEMPEEKLRWHCEQTIRNYDPCISCATHFLKLELESG